MNINIYKNTAAGFTKYQHTISIVKLNMVDQQTNIFKYRLSEVA